MHPSLPAVELPFLPDPQIIKPSRFPPNLSEAVLPEALPQFGGHGPFAVAQGESHQPVTAFNPCMVSPPARTSTICRVRGSCSSRKASQSRLRAAATDGSSVRAASRSPIDSTASSPASSRGAESSSNQNSGITSLFPSNWHGGGQGIHPSAVGAAPAAGQLPGGEVGQVPGGHFLAPLLGGMEQLGGDGQAVLIHFFVVIGTHLGQTRNGGPQSRGHFVQPTDIQLVDSCCGLLF